MCVDGLLLPESYSTYFLQIVLQRSVGYPEVLRTYPRALASSPRAGGLPGGGGCGVETRRAGLHPENEELSGLALLGGVLPRGRGWGPAGAWVRRALDTPGTAPRRTEAEALNFPGDLWTPGCRPACFHLTNEAPLEHFRQCGPSFSVYFVIEPFIWSLKTLLFSSLEIPCSGCYGKGGESPLAEDGGPSPHRVPRAPWCRGPAGGGAWPGVLTSSAGCVTPSAPGHEGAQRRGHASVVLGASLAPAPRPCPPPALHGHKTETQGGSSPLSHVHLARG